MLIPIRCFTCGKPIGHLWGDFQKQTKGGRGKKEALDSLGLERYCCRSIFLTHRDVTHRIGLFKK